MHTWDMRMRRCLSRHVDEGCFTSTALAAAADSSLYATGSKAGVVNIYSYPQRSAPHPGFLIRRASGSSPTACPCMARFRKVDAIST